VALFQCAAKLLPPCNVSNSDCVLQVSYKWMVIKQFLVPSDEHFRIIKVLWSVYIVLLSVGVQELVWINLKPYCQNLLTVLYLVR